MEIHVKICTSQSNKSTLKKKKYGDITLVFFFVSFLSRLCFPPVLDESRPKKIILG